MRPSTTRCANTCCGAKGFSKQKAQKNEMLPAALPVVQASKFELVTEVCYPFGRKHGRHRAVKRREFITLLGGAAIWPLAARAQQAERMRRIGVLANLPENDPDGRSRNAALLEELHQLGWTEGRNVQIDYRFALGNMARLRQYAAELVALAPEAILATGQEATGALQQATCTVPIVFVLAPDPVGAGFVDSLARPGGNVTGFTPWEYSISAKWLELLKEIAPGVKRVAVLRDAVVPEVGQFAIIQAAAPSLGVDVSPIS